MKKSSTRPGDRGTVGWLSLSSGEGPSRSIFREGLQETGCESLREECSRERDQQDRGHGEGVLGMSPQEQEVGVLGTRGKGEGGEVGRSPVRTWEELDSPSP